VQALLAKLREWTEKLGDDFDVSKMAEQVGSILTGLEELSNSEDLRASLAGMNKLVNDEELQQIAGKLSETLQGLQDATADARSLIQSTGGQIETITADLTPLFAELSDLMEQAELVIVSAKQQLRSESGQMYQFRATLEEVESAALALREFFDYLERHPESLLGGKK
jgi:paraquat-inducible protein B